MASPESFDRLQPLDDAFVIRLITRAIDAYPCQPEVAAHKIFKQLDELGILDRRRIDPSGDTFDLEDD